MIQIHTDMIAACGMICSFCYVHHKHKKPCLGCRAVSESTPNSCRKCDIKACASEKGHTYCSSCEDFPCVLIKRLDKSYRTRYDISLIDILKDVSLLGPDECLKKYKTRFTCSRCSGTLNMHDLICYDCGLSDKK